MKARVRLFAIARQLAGTEMLELELPHGATVAELRTKLAGTFPALHRVVEQAMFAVDGEYAADERVLKPEADIACIPPVSGG